MPCDSLLRYIDSRHVGYNDKIIDIERIESPALARVLRNYAEARGPMRYTHNWNNWPNWPNTPGPDFPCDSNFPRR